MRILLINPPGIPVREGRYTNPPPLGLLYLASVLLQNGFDVKVVDGCRDGKEEVIKTIREFSAEVIGITCLTAARKNAIELADIAKEINFKTIVVFGGVHSTIMYKQMMENYLSIDFIVFGEGEQTFLELVQGKDPKDIDGLIFRAVKKIIKNQRRKNIENLDDIPFPAWHLVDFKNYQPWFLFETENGKDFVFRDINLTREICVPVIFSRGCTGHCNFCSTWWVWNGWRHRSAKNMVDEIELLYNKYSIRHFRFADDTLTVDRQATIELCNEIIRRDLKIAFHAITRTDCVDEEVLKKMSTAGCYGLAFGIETGSSELLSQIRKENSVQNTDQAVQWAKKFNIKVSAQIMVGNIGETIETVVETIEMLNRLSPERVSAMNLIILPGTKVYEDCKKEGFIDDDFWLSNIPYKTYTKEWPNHVLSDMAYMAVNYRYFNKESVKKCLIGYK